MPALHPAQAQSLLMPDKTSRANRRASNKALSRIVPELESGIFINGIIQAAGGADHRDGSVLRL